MKKYFFNHQSFSEGKIIFFLFLSFFSLKNSFSQTPGEWVWLHGDSTTNNPGNFGIQGVSSPTNEPPSLYEACEWTDNNGNFWLFGGCNLFGGYSDYSDLWKYNPVNNEWTWVKGPGTIGFSGNYGVQGIPSPFNNPPAKSYGADSWVDLNGNLWMFGGAGGTNWGYSDLWKYDISTNEWTWMKGPNTGNDPGVYGIKGIADPANYPRSREETSASWTDNAGDLWLFGGEISPTVNNLNDLWKFNVATNCWTWMNGSQITNQPSVYGTMGIEDPVNTPGARMVYSRWKDSSGNLWLYGGEEDWNGSQNNRTDLWRFNPATNNWAWISGDTIGNLITANGSMCTPAAENRPLEALESRASWTDASGNFWGLIISYGIYNSLWMYCVATNQWSIIKADSSTQSGRWGVKGVSTPLNIPPAIIGSIGWTDHHGHLYLFGGEGNTWYNALWMYTIDPCCSACNTGAPVESFAATDTSICPGTCLNIINNSQSYSGYQWQFPGANPSSSNLINPQNICYPTSGTYDITLIANGCNRSDTISMNNYINVFSQPSPQSISQNGDTLFAITGATTYQWYFNGNVINGATNYFYVAEASGDYNIVATDTNGCEVEAAIFSVVANAFDVSGLKFEVYPNPVGNMLTVTGYPLSGTAVEVSVYNMLGELVLAATPLSAGEQYGGDAAVTPLSAGEGPGGEADVSQLPPGLYYLVITAHEKSFHTKFVKE
jgi:hypothetical protein